MPSSISSSDLSEAEGGIPRADWSRALWMALLVAFGIMLAIEIGLRVRGYAPTVQDSPELWSLFRRQASNHQDRNLVLVGASRIQLDLDLDVLREETGLEPIQLGIDGGSYVPVLAELAADPTVRSTILVDYVDHVLSGAEYDAVAAQWVALHQRRPRPWEAPSVAIETWLGHAVRSHLASFADGATALTSGTRRLLDWQSERQYIETLPDRSRRADYRLVQMPKFAYERALRHIGRPDLADPEATAAMLDARISEALAATRAADITPTVLQRIELVRGAVEAIQARGGRVVFVRFPTAGSIRTYDERRYPAELFLDAFRARVPTPVLSFDEIDTLVGFECPDGSHLDRRDRGKFTRTLARELVARGALPVSP